jgi:hypothetical protein
MQFVKLRPREWIALLGFRATTCEPELGYIEYTVSLQVSQLYQQVCNNTKQLNTLRSFRCLLAASRKLAKCWCHRYIESGWYVRACWEFNRTHDRKTPNIYLIRSNLKWLALPSNCRNNWVCGTMHLPFPSLWRWRDKAEEIPRILPRGLVHRTTYKQCFSRNERQRLHKI